MRGAFISFLVLIFAMRYMRYELFWGGGAHERLLIYALLVLPWILVFLRRNKLIGAAYAVFTDALLLVFIVPEGAL